MNDLYDIHFQSKSLISFTEVSIQKKHQNRSISRCPNTAGLRTCRRTQAPLWTGDAFSSHFAQFEKIRLKNSRSLSMIDTIFDSAKVRIKTLSAHRWMTSTSVNPTFSILCRTIKITSMLETVATTLVLARSTSSSTDLYFRK
jgi:hypothetical protein